MVWISGKLTPGPDNPRKYNGESDYSVAPTKFEMPAYIHDKDYDAVGAVGAKCLLIDTKTTAADNKFVASMDKLVNEYKEVGNAKMEGRAIIVREGLNSASQPKQMVRDFINSIMKAITVPTTLTIPIF